MAEGGLSAYKMYYADSPFWCSTVSTLYMKQCKSSCFQSWVTKQYFKDTPLCSACNTFPRSTDTLQVSNDLPNGLMTKSYQYTTRYVLSKNVASKKIQSFDFFSFFCVCATQPDCRGVPLNAVYPVDRYSLLVLAPLRFGVCPPYHICSPGSSSPRPRWRAVTQEHIHSSLALTTRSTTKVWFK